MNNLNSTLEVENLNLVGLDINKSEELSKKLNTLLANYSIFYQNTRGYHWNLRGQKFFELHLKFEELYNHLSTKIDEIAERILTIGFPANHNFTDYKTMSKITEATKVSDGVRSAEDVLKSLRYIISLEREILTYANKMGDEGTYTLMSETIKNQEKMVWMYAAYLEK